MARSILGTVGLALTLAFAIPVALLGLDFLVRGRTLEGAAFLGIAALMVAVEEYVTTPTDIPGMVAGRVLGSAVKEPEDSGDAEDGSTGGTPTEADTRRPDGEGSPEDTTDDTPTGAAGGEASEPLIPDAEERSGEE